MGSGHKYSLHHQLWTQRTQSSSSVVDTKNTVFTISCGHKEQSSSLAVDTKNTVFTISCGHKEHRLHHRQWRQRTQYSPSAVETKNTVFTNISGDKEHTIVIITVSCVCTEHCFQLLPLIQRKNTASSPSPPLPLHTPSHLCPSPPGEAIVTSSADKHTQHSLCH